MSNTWASKFFKSLSSEEKMLIDTNHKQHKQAEELRKTEMNRKKQATWRAKQDVWLQNRYGKFWFFVIEQTENDSSEARIMRNNLENQSHFEEYLLNKYGWRHYSIIEDCISSEDDCHFTRFWTSRFKRQMSKEHEFIQRMVDEKHKRDAAKKEQRINKMRADVLSGKISQGVYEKWKEMVDAEDDYKFEMDMVKIDMENLN